MFGLPPRHRKCHCRNERGSFGIILSLQLSAVRFYDSADAIQTKTVMALSDVSKRFTSPIVGVRSKAAFWFIERKQELAIADSGARNQCALAAIVPKSVGKKLDKHFLQQLRINIQHRVPKLNVPGDLRAFP